MTLFDFDTKELHAFFKATILVKSLGTLRTFASIWSFCPPPHPHPEHNVDVDSSKIDPLLQHCFEGERGLAN